MGSHGILRRLTPNTAPAAFTVLLPAPDGTLPAAQPEHTHQEVAGRGQEGS